MALDQAGAYIEETGCGLLDYLHLYKERHRDLLALRKSLAAEHPEPVATTWSLSFQKIEEANPAASALLCVCAFLAPDAIAEKIFTEGASQLGEVLEPVAADPLKWNQALEEVRRYSLLKRQPATKSLSIHRLVQAVLRDKMTLQEQRQWAERAIRAVNAVFPLIELETWARCERYLSQAQVCAQLLEQYDLSFEEAARLLHQTGLYLVEHARYTEAERYYQQALQIFQKVLSAEHRAIATTLHELGRVNLNQGRYVEAERYYQQALQIYQKVLPAEHRDTAVTLHELGRAYVNQGRYAEAERYYQQALQIYQKVLPGGHPYTIISLRNYAYLLRLMEREDDARALEQQIQNRITPNAD
jgi:tetratricopeptide (TPR) repeat protein